MKRFYFKVILLLIAVSFGQLMKPMDGISVLGMQRWLRQILAIARWVHMSFSILV